MYYLRRSTLSTCLLLTGLVLGCSSKPQPMKNGTPVSGDSGAAKPVPINPSSKKKLFHPEVDGPPAPPIKTDGSRQ